MRYTPRYTPRKVQAGCDFLGILLLSRQMLSAVVRGRATWGEDAGLPTCAGGRSGAAGAGTSALMTHRPPRAESVTDFRGRCQLQGWGAGRRHLSLPALPGA